MTAAGRSGSPAHRAGLAAVCLVFAALYVALLLRTDGLPYVFDNNESFSSLWHAMSLDAHGVGQSKGLADEAASPHAAAHPYVHTHQGNMPRLFAWAIYALGARTPELQIVTTTMSVGLATVVLIYLFFARLATPAFGLLAALVFMTDYILFAQWQVVTYRVWYAALLFAGLCSIERAAATGRRRWLLAVFTVSMLLFYFELVFAAFTSALCGLFLICLSWRSPLAVLRVGAVQVLGAVTGLSVLVAQGIAYLGAADFMRDIRLTFLARNDAAAAPQLLDEAARFYESRNVIFWHNLQDRASFAGPGAFLRAFTESDWKVHTPLLFWVVVVLLVGCLLAMLPRAALERRLGALCARGPAVRAGLALVAYSVLFAGLFGLVLFLPAIVHGSPGQGGLPSLLIGGVVALALCLLAAAACAIGDRDAADPAGACSARQAVSLLLAGLVPAAGAVVLAFSDSLFDRSASVLWMELYRGLGLHRIYPVVMLAAVVVAALIAVSRPAHGRALAGSVVGPLRWVFLYLACGVSAFAIVHFLSPGYVHSGYLMRHAPFTVFLTDVALAAALHATFSATALWIAKIRGDRASREAVRRGGSASLRAYLCVSCAAACVGLSLLLVAFWISMQATYVRLVPPDHFAFLKQLARPPFAGASAVVNNYAAPVAAYTGQWAYFDPLISQAYVVQTPAGARIAADDRYLWFADRATNADYRRPDYFICMIPQTMEMLLARLAFQQKRGPSPPGCTDLPLVDLARAGSSRLPGFELVAHDEAGIGRTGFSSWAIVRLDWTRGIEVDYDIRSFRRDGAR